MMTAVLLKAGISLVPHTTVNSSISIITFVLLTKQLKVHISKKQVNVLLSLTISKEVQEEWAVYIFTRNSHQKSTSGLNLFCCIYEKQKSQQGHCYLLG